MERKVTLKNGVRILTEEIPHVYSVSIGFWVDNGSKNESENVWGISHFIEHMLFKGTKIRTAMQIAQELEDTGGSINAFTDKENTCFYARVLDIHTNKAIDVLSDIYLNSIFDENEIEREKQVVIEELKMYEDSPDDLSFDLLTEKIWEHHPLGHRIVGTEETIKAFSREKIINYMSENYTSDRLVITIAGNINHDDVVKQLEEKLSIIPEKKSSFSENIVEYKSNLIHRYKDIEQLHVCLGTKGTYITDSKRFHYAVLDSILGGGMSSKLFQEIREKKGLAYSIGSYELIYRRAGIFGVYAGISPNNLNDLVKSVMFELDQIKAGNLSEVDVHRAKEQLKGGLLLSLEAVRNRMMRLARNEIYFHRQISAQEIIDAVEKVDQKSIVELANDIFDRNKISLVTVGPIKETKIDLATI